MKYSTHQRLQIFANWLENTQSEAHNVQGEMEKRIEDAKAEVMRQIGDHLDEILNMTDEQIETEINPCPDGDI